VNESPPVAGAYPTLTRRIPDRVSVEPTSGLEPLTCSYRDPPEGEE
jgi:hypothetical protein